MLVDSQNEGELEETQGQFFLPGEYLNAHHEDPQKS